MPVSYSSIEIPVLYRNTFLNNAKELLITDDNTKPVHINIPAKNTEFFARKNSDTLVIVVGESWTYGEALPGIGTGAGLFNIVSQFEYCMGPRISEVTGYDLYQFAIPGNNNMYMQFELRRILKEVEKYNYKNIKIVMQMTESSRELPIMYFPFALEHPLRKWYDYPETKSIDIIEWLAWYEKIFFDYFQETINNHTQCSVDAILWRNFTRLHTEDRNYSFKIIEPTWITHTARLVNHEHVPPSLLNPIEFDKYFDQKGKKVIVSKDFMEEQFNLIDKMFDYIGGKIESLKGFLYHNNHPTEYGHLVWAHHLIRQAGWKDI